MPMRHPAAPPETTCAVADILLDPATGKPPMMVLVTGATGFLGSRVVRDLIREGLIPRALVRPGHETALQTRVGVELARGNLFDRESLASAVKGVDAILHLAGRIIEQPQTGETFHRLHVEGTENLLETAASAGITRFIYLSALGAEADHPDPFLGSKGQAERLVRDSGLAYTILRPSLMFGPEDHFLTRLAALLRPNGTLPLIRAGLHPLRPVAVETVSQGAVRALKEPKSMGQTYEICGPERLSIEELAGAAGRLRGLERVRVRAVPRWFPGAPVELSETLQRIPEGSPIGPYYETFNLTPVPLAQAMRHPFQRL